MTILNFHQARFFISAPDLQHCPPEEGREVAFAGRSNAGKSSAINALTNNSKLAKTSKTPGRTQLINYFSLDESELLRLVDLPGYGYAKVAKDMKRQWQEALSTYLYERQSLAGLILLMDIRHPLQDFDQMLLNWSMEKGMPVHILLTKSDKLKRGARANTLRGIQHAIDEAGLSTLVSAQAFSSLKKEGLDELEGKLTRWLLEDTASE